MIPDINFITGKAHSRLVEIPILTTQSAQSQIPFPDQPDLRYARIVAMEAIFNSDLAMSQPSNYQVVDGTDARKLTVILDTNDPDDTGHWLVNPETGEPILKNGQHVWVPPKMAQHTAGRFTSTQQNQKYLPLACLHRVQNAGSATSAILGPDPFVRDLQTFYNMYVSWDKAILQVQNGGLGNSVNKAVCLMVYYSWLDINNMPIPRK